MIGFCYFPKHGNKIPQVDDTLIKVMTSVGTIVGQLFFGWLADRVGRKRMYGYELLIIMLATLGQCITGPSSAIGITGLLVFWRILMGIGIGGDYPLANIITSEFASTKWRGTMVAAVFSTQALGQFIASLVAVVVIAAFRSQIDNGNNVCEDGTCTQTVAAHLAVDRMWRIIIGVGAVPAALALYYRLTIPETPRYTFDVNRDVEQGFADYKGWVQNTIGPRTGQGEVDDERRAIRAGLRPGETLGGLDAAVVPQSSWSDFRRYFRQGSNGWILLGTCGSWFFLDVAYYALALNNTIFLQKMGFGSVNNSDPTRLYTILWNGAIGNLVLVVAGAIPGSICAILLVDRIGRKSIQVGGFAMITILLLILGSSFESMSDASRVAVFVLILFFVNFGPNSTTFIVPGECFPTRYRSTCHGLAAASGKIGAVLAQALTGPLRGIGFEKGKTDASPWLPHVIQILGAFAMLGLLCSFLIPETMGRSLEKLAGEEPRALEGEEASDDEDTRPKSLLELMWVSCTPVVLFQWLFRTRGHAAEYDDINGSKGALTEERISLSMVGAANEPSPAKPVVPEGDLSEQQGDGGLKLLETEVERLSGESSDRRAHDDEIQRIT
ncbi:MFS transporter, PHS family, inorganic phosphate transporter [Cladophialophora psammophila CBS 110553]|uniref:MFS transporter, PHS family, inorganic phosphate transporter n=1 Tax=Cladophialophora psammophila CBS 110553 TaxID=1182543 RepID=W9WT32_9EURO|nr:MFS transporter, PHS family, inorganic phosphate transporter [Cladophialophora psammophila CBS 110553]EXJ67816.1 MFS transporter, PHS family, inorganic phosphate transporter [Cladophialophora psammophila CBS 110553]